MLQSTFWFPLLSSQFQLASSMAISFPFPAPLQQFPPALLAHVSRYRLSSLCPLHPLSSCLLPSLSLSAPPGLLPEEILTPTLYHGYYVRPRAARAGEGARAGASELRLSEGKFQAFLDVSHFTPDEVTVRTVDNLLEVSARHPQRLDRHGFVSREFCRTYVLPADVDPWRVRAALSHDGILNLEAPRGGRHLDTEINEVYISLLPAPPDPEEEEEIARVEP